MEPIKKILLQQGRSEAWANGAENQSVHLTYDIGAHLSVWPDAVPSVAFERADGSKYPHAWELEGTILHIPLLLADTEVPGSCKCMITLTQGDGRSNTAIFYGVVTRGIDSLGEEPEEPMLGVIEQVNRAAADAHTAKVGAEAAQKEAKDSADLASGYEYEARASASNARAYAADSREHSVLAINAKIKSESAANLAQTAAEGAATSEENAVNAANEAEEHAQSAKENAEEAREYANEAKAAADDINSDFFVIKYDGTAFDKTYSEIESAARSGKMPVVVNSRTGDYYLYGTLDSYNRRYFDRFAYDHDGKFFNYRLRLDTDNTVSNQSRGVVKTPTENKLKFTGAVSGEYDGSSPLTIDIPEGGGSESNVLVVNVAYNSAENRYEADKTFDEILSAINSGVVPVLSSDGASFFLETTSTGTIGFCRFVNTVSGIRKYQFYILPNKVLFSASIIKAPNPNALTLTGAVEAEYDGSTAVNVEIPVDNVFLVHVTSNAGKLTADKTLAEIIAAKDAGLAPLAIFNTCIYTFSRTSGNAAAYFLTYDIDTSTGITAIRQILVTSDSVSQKSLDVKAQNPNKLTFTGAVEAEYDGSQTVTVNIPNAEDDFFLVTIADDSYGLRGDMELSDILNRIKESKYPIAVYKRNGYTATLLLSSHSSESVHFSTYWRSGSDQAFDARDELTEIKIVYYGRRNINVIYGATVKAVNPKKITFTGASNATYDGSEDVTVNIPEGGGSGGGGATPNWDANEGEDGYIENRTHWVERGAGEDVLYDNETLVYKEDVGGFLVTNAPKRDFVDGETIKVTFGEAVFECPCTYIQDPDSGVVGYIIGNVGAVNPGIEMNDVPFVFIMLPVIQDIGDGTMAQGLFMPMGELGTTEFSMAAKSDLYHKLDYRYVGTKYSQPDWGKDSVIVKEGVYTILAEDEPVVPFFSPVELHAGEKYEVTYFGEKYECIAVEHPEVGLLIGNPAGFGGIDNGDPFLFIAFTEEAAVEQGAHALFIPLDGFSSGAITLSIVGLNGAGAVHKIPKEYIENPNAPLIVELFDEGTELRYTPEYDEIEKALYDGRVVRAKRTDRSGNGMYAYAGSSNGKIDFIAPDGSINEWGIERISLNPSGTAQEMLFKFVPESN